MIARERETKRNIDARLKLVRVIRLISGLRVRPIIN